MKQFSFNKKYFYFFLIFFNLEIGIALFIKQPFIRYFCGDVFVVILLYTFIKSFLNVATNKTLFFVLSFAFLIEFFQYYKGIELLGLQNNTLAKIVLGTTFSVSDLGAYTLGVICIFIVKKAIKKNQSLPST